MVIPCACVQVLRLKGGALGLFFILTSFKIIEKFKSMRYAQVPGYNPSFPVKYGNMYRDYSMTTSSFSDPFNLSKTEDSSKCGYVVSYNGKDEPKYQMNNPAYMREVSRSFSDSIPEVVLNKRPFQA